MEEAAYDADDEKLRSSQKIEAEREETDQSEGQTKHGNSAVGSKRLRMRAKSV